MYLLREFRSTHIKLFRKELHDVFNDRAFTRKTEAFQEKTQSFIHSQVMEMERPKNNITLLTFVTSHTKLHQHYRCPNLVIRGIDLVLMIYIHCTHIK